MICLLKGEKPFWDSLRAMVIIYLLGPYFEYSFGLDRRKSETEGGTSGLAVLDLTKE